MAFQTRFDLTTVAAQRGSSAARTRLAVQVGSNLDPKLRIVVFSAGPYFSIGPYRESGWSKLLRAAKDPSAIEGGWESLRRVCDRGVERARCRAPVLGGRVDAVVSVPSRKCRPRPTGSSR